MSIANTRGPETLRELTDELGAGIHAVPLGQAPASDVVLMAIPFPAIAEFGRSLPDWTGKTVVDATNAHSSSSSSDDPEAGERIAKLVDTLGLAAIQLGHLAEGGRLIEAPNALVLRNLVERPLS